MSENLIHVSVPGEMIQLATLAGFDCESFQHQLMNSRFDFAGPGAQTIINYDVPANSGLVITAVDIKVLYDIADIPLADGDFRSTFDLNPQGPYAAGASVGQITLLVNDQPAFATAWDIGVINAGVMFVISGGSNFKISVNPNQPAGAALTLITRLNTYVVPQRVGVELKKKETRIVTL